MAGRPSTSSPARSEKFQNDAEIVNGFVNETPRNGGDPATQRGTGKTGYEA
jgi:hypothetical protein